MKYSIIRPQTHRSARIGLYRWVGPSLDPSSGAIHGGVPHQSSVIVSWLSTDWAKSKSMMNKRGDPADSDILSTTTFPGLRSQCATLQECRKSTPSINWRQRGIMSAGRSWNRKTSSSGDFHGSTIIVLPILRSMASSNGMVWFDGALIPLRYSNNRRSLESTIVLRTMETPLREIAQRIVSLSFDDLLVRPTISCSSSVSYDLQESVA